MQTIEQKINEIVKLVGEPYVMYNEDMTYRGCFRPIQLLYPNIQKYKLRSKDDDKNYFYGIAKIRKHCTEIEKKDLQMGDMIVTRFRDELHVALYLQYGKILHVFKDHTLQIGRMKMFKNIQCFRINE